MKDSRSEEDKANAAELYKRGMSAIEVADFYGRTTVWVYQQLKAHGVKARRSSRPLRPSRPDVDFANRARTIVANAVKRGILVPQPCEICGDDSPISNGQRGTQAHHDDYNKPLDVRWLCPKHHKEWHKNNKPIPMTPEVKRKGFRRDGLTTKKLTNKQTKQERIIL